MLKNKTKRKSCKAKPVPVQSLDDILAWIAKIDSSKEEILEVRQEYQVERNILRRLTDPDSQIVLHAIINSIAEIDANIVELDRERKELVCKIAAMKTKV